MLHLNRIILCVYHFYLKNVINEGKIPCLVDLPVVVLSMFCKGFTSH